MRAYMNDDFFVRPRDNKNKRGGRGGPPPMTQGGYYDERPSYYAPPMYDSQGRPNLRYRIEDRHPYPYDNRGSQYGYDYNYQNYGPPP